MTHRLSTFLRAAAPVLLASLVSLAATTTASAANVADEADALFASGKELMAKQRFGEACPMFEKSYALERADGTLLALGLCHEADGQRARAWRELSAVLVLATRSARKDRQRVAQAALTRIEPLVGRLVVRVADRKVLTSGNGVDIHRDAEALGNTEIDVEVAVEPGHHVVTAVRDGRVVWQREVDVDQGRASEVIVPASLPAPSPPPSAEEPAKTEATQAPAPIAPPPPAAATAAGSSRVPITALILGGAGIVSLGVGSYFGLRSMSKWDDVEGRCDPRACKDRSALDDASEAKSSALAANVFIGGGAALVFAGAAFWFFGRKDPSSATPAHGRVPVIAPLVGNGGAGAIVTTRF